MSLSPRLSLVPPTPMNLPSFLPYASAQLQAPYIVRVLTEIQEEYVSKQDEKSKKVVKGKSIVMPQQLSCTHTELQEESISTQATNGSIEIVVIAVQDSASRLLELSFKRCKKISRMLMQIIALCVPYQPFLTKLTVHWAQLGGETLYEIAKFLPQSQLTDICLDDSPVPEKNYHCLLEHEQLRCLSLARCRLDDNDCLTIAGKLVHPLPASRNLYILSLVSNKISDVGACALAEVLRSNRTLQHLNLAGNRISDVGACALFRSMREFPLTYSELIMKRHRFFQYLQLKNEVYLKCFNDLTAAWIDRQAVESSRVGKQRKASMHGRKMCTGAFLPVESGSGQEEVVTMRAATMTNELVGSYSDPFRLEETVSKEGYVYSLGNTRICFLNLAHNELGYASVVALRDVLQYQEGLVRKTGSGLLRVVMDGNPLPAACDEYKAIEDLLERVIMTKRMKSLKTKKPEKISKIKIK